MIVHPDHGVLLHRYTKPKSLPARHVRRPEEVCLPLLVRLPGTSRKAWMGDIGGRDAEYR